MDEDLPDKVKKQIAKQKLPRNGDEPFKPRLRSNRREQQVLERKKVLLGPKKGEVGFVDIQGRVWVKDAAHANLPEHWDVQIDDGKGYLRIDLDGKRLP